MSETTIPDVPEVEPLPPPDVIVDPPSPESPEVPVTPDDPLDFPPAPPPVTPPVHKPFPERLVSALSALDYGNLDRICSVASELPGVTSVFVRRADGHVSAKVTRKEGVYEAVLDGDSVHVVLPTKRNGFR